MTVIDHSIPVPPKRQVKTASQTPTKWQIYTAADPTVERIIPSLAKEIGLNESIVLMQIAFWIKTSNNIVDGAYWTYQTMADMQEKAFPYWSVDTIRRIVHNLKKKGYILIGQHNKRKGDNTQWYALEPDALSSLKSIIVKEIEPEVVPPYSQVASMPYSQVATPPLQDRTALPETPTDIENTSTPKGAEKKPRKASKNEPYRNALLAVFNLSPETVTFTGDKTYWTAAADFGRIQFPIEYIPEYHRWCKSQNWKAFSVMAMAKHAGEWLAKKQPPTKIIPLELEPTDYPDTADYINLAGGA